MRRCVKVRVDVEILDKLIDLELLHYRSWDVAKLEDTIRFEQSAMQRDQERLEGTREPMDVRVLKVENDQGIVIVINESEQCFADILPRTQARHKAFGTPESHDGSFANHSDFDLRRLACHGCSRPKQREWDGPGSDILRIERFHAE